MRHADGVGPPFRWGPGPPRSPLCRRLIRWYAPDELAAYRAAWDAGHCPLTLREREAAVLLASGFGKRLTAWALGIRPRSVESLAARVAARVAPDRRARRAWGGNQFAIANDALADLMRRALADAA